jgi:hypothetical protein
MATPSLPASPYTTRFAFQHIANHDGTSNSICLRCHGTVASSHNEFSLELAESTHICVNRMHLLARTSARSA